MRRENEDLSHGAILKGLLEDGTGEEAPQEGDLVIFRPFACTR